MTNKIVEVIKKLGIHSDDEAYVLSTIADAATGRDLNKGIAFNRIDWAIELSLRTTGNYTIRNAQNIAYEIAGWITDMIFPW